MRSLLFITTVLLVIVSLFAGCATPAPAPAGKPTDAAKPAPAATSAPAAAAKLKVGLVTDQGGVNDKSFNQSAWTGAQKAGKDLGIDTKFIESKQPTDYEKNIDQFATEKYDVIIGVGFLMADAVAAKAVQYPTIKFAIIDAAYFPTKGAKICDDTKKDCYDDGGLKNVTSLMFQEDEAGFLAGALAGSMTKSGTVCSVGGMEIPPVVRFIVGFQNGAKFAKSDVKTLNVYIPDFTAPAKGKEAAITMLGQNCDVVFAAAGNTGNGALLAAKEKGVMAIGVDVDQYLTYPEVKDALATSAAKNVDVAVFSYLKSITEKSAKSGIAMSNLKNGGVGLAPYHDWESKIPDAVKAKVKEAQDGLLSGKLVTGYKP
jgi:basic membrane protein A and related proteins